MDPSNTVYPLIRYYLAYYDFSCRICIFAVPNRIFVGSGICVNPDICNYHFGPPIYYAFCMFYYSYSFFY